MDRRRFLKFATAGCGVLMMPNIGRATDGVDRSDSLSFYAAGVRFCKIPSKLQSGTPLHIATGTFKGEKCYAIYALDGVKIGYVPKQLVPIVNRSTIRRSYLSLVDAYAVPWKRYEVTLLLRERGKIT